MKMTRPVTQRSLNGFAHLADRGKAGLVEEGVVGEVDEQLRAEMMHVQKIKYASDHRCAGQDGILSVHTWMTC